MGGNTKPNITLTEEGRAFAQRRPEGWFHKLQECGILACASCKEEKLIPFSCKGRST
jgi:hypothetical protein